MESQAFSPETVAEEREAAEVTKPKAPPKPRAPRKRTPKAEVAEAATTTASENVAPTIPATEPISEPTVQADPAPDPEPVRETSALRSETPSAPDTPAEPAPIPEVAAEQPVAAESADRTWSETKTDTPRFKARLVSRPQPPAQAPAEPAPAPTASVNGTEAAADTPVAPPPVRERPPQQQQQQQQQQQPRQQPQQDRQHEPRQQDQRNQHRRPQRDRDRDRDRDQRSPDLIQRDGPTLNVSALDALSLPELQTLARDLEVQNVQRYRKPELVGKILQAQTEAQGFKYGSGVLDIIEDGFGFLRGERYLPGSDDIYVSQSQIRRFGLRTGDMVSGQIRPPKDNEKFHSLLRVEAVNGIDPETARRRPSFDQLTPIFPLELIDLETQPHVLSTRILNLTAPIGRGQRGLIVSPPKAGKTLILKAIANGVTTNYHDIHLMVCLIGERPEEVTDMKRSVDGEVISSTFDEPVEDHTKVAEMVLERAKRLVEGGRDVVILLDSITRLARAYNLAVPPSGRTLSGGIDPIALYPPKRFFGAARNIEGGGSLTIIATCLVDTGSRMDDVIYEEFKGTGNMELHLDRKLSERRIFPAIDIQRSGTRRDDLLLDDNTMRQVITMRRMVSMLGGTEGTELLLGRLAKTQNNAEFLVSLTRDV